MKKTTLLAAALLLTGSFLAAQGDAPKERKLHLAKPVSMTADTEVYGAALKNDKEVVPVATLHKDAKAWDGKVVQVRGKIAGVCAKKGCWMVIREGEKDIQVKFKDYKFFVPLDVANRDVAAEGKVQVTLLTEAERRHYAEDAGKGPEEIEKIVGDVTTVTFIADAVQIGKLPPAPKKDGCCGGTTTGDAPAKSEGCCGDKKTEGCCGDEAKKTEKSDKPLPTGGCCEELKKTEKSSTEKSQADKPLPTGGCCEELKKPAEKK